MFVFFIQNVVYFFKKLLKFLSFIRICIFNFLFISVILLVFMFFFHVNFFNMSATSRFKALRINLVGNLIDKPINDNNFNKFFHTFFKNNDIVLKENSLFDIINRIRLAKEDCSISGIVLDLKDFLSSDLSSLIYLGKVLMEFRSSGKYIYALGDNYTQTQYFLASFSNKIYLSPEGVVDLHGFSNYNLYYKDFLNKLRVNTHVFRAGIYKSAVEPFIFNKMSTSSKKIYNNLTNNLWKNYLLTISRNRHVNIHRVFPDIDNMLLKLKIVNGDYSKYAKYLGLIDIIKSRTLVEKDFEKIFGINKESKTYNFIDIYDYYPKSNKSSVSFNVAVIVINGIISDIKSPLGISNSDLIINQIRYARLTNNIKAIILRINSPGGSVSASEKIYNELLTLKYTGKPLIVSMGGMAASGGYWITTTSNYIIGDCNTITGSIGVFGILNTLDRSLHSIGINSDGVSTSVLSDISIFRSLPVKVKQIIQLNILHKYNNFIKLVSLSRNKTICQIDKIAKGHIWLGKEAKSNGLIDELGDFDSAVSKAIELANLKYVNLYWFNNSENILSFVIDQLKIFVNDIFLNKVNNSFSVQLVNNYINNSYYFFNKKNTIYSFCFFNLCLI
ncbi:signal peptide peptidase SppA [Candidatus Purcelliella pentastirinorum]|uniref:signal peptide peptidase SppA n=1 Tax=Candidatus Purcelliella pentastirinorum TaxID=472834 RepID=UPI002367C92B|nr:signal peptide peptidase SppA [Candidatus Purcelliella pentastirinorum]WDI78887.1 signal peptide peptidase SppA [Candidatus Purcelliella pentastirinorum]WDR80021.1 signal peptide peptidase SppA [Candidatus Purcelliella pentastirinorum]